jgi:hypothetical protein
MPLLTQPATLPPPTTEEDKDEVGLEPEAEAPGEEDAPKKGKKGKGGGGGKKGKSGKGKKEETEVVEEEAGEVLLIDEIWPKKEALGLTKWYVISHQLTYTVASPDLADRTAMIVYLYIQSIQYPSLSSISTDHSSPLSSFYIDVSFPVPSIPRS